MVTPKAPAWKVRSRSQMVSPCAKGSRSGCGGRWRAQRIDVGDQVPSLAPRVIRRATAACFMGSRIDHRRGGLVRLPTEGADGNIQVRENAVVEAVFAFQQRLQPRQEQARLRALDHAMIVGAGDRHHLAQAQRGAHVFRHAAIFGRIIDRAGGDDRALSRHQARNRADGAHGSGIGERNGGAFEIGDGQLVGAGALDQIVISGQELREIHRLRVLDRRNLERARAFLALDVHRQAQIHVLAGDPERTFAGFGISLIQRGHLSSARTMAHATRCV